MAAHVEMLSGRNKKDYRAEQAADSLADQAQARGEAPASEPIPESAFDPGSSDDDDEDDDEALAEGAESEAVTAVA